MTADSAGYLPHLPSRDHPTENGITVEKPGDAPKVWPPTAFVKREANKKTTYLQIFVGGRHSVIRKGK